MVHLKSLFRRPSSYETVYPYDSHQQRPEFPPYDPELAEVYRHRRHIGVNLGSVFILNKQGSPSSVRSSIIKHAWESELDFLNACTTERQAREALEDHWSHYINEKDFELLASVGINAVRIPIGYFTLGPEFATGCFKKYSRVYRSAWYYFLKLVKMAGDYNIGVLVDLHGAPGKTIICQKKLFFLSYH
jgi:aryl-phospho-beta-D-glucosidase BglC (GH1 family)